eukprot:Seg1894.4 transcript_id=Seg1894.4/GoldUCD/mRNA.D3Y31 product="hypothetical protein" protein_id=Seg1894.4/GoldUCD/D3Y31
MPPKIKVRSIKRKKRKFHGNRFTKRKEQDEEDILLPNSSSNDVDTSIGVVRPNSPSSDEEMADELLPTENLTTPKTRLPASVRNITIEEESMKMGFASTITVACKKERCNSPQHHLCPNGTDSWCGFRRDVAKKTHLHQHDHPLPAAVAEKIKDVFHALSEESLLSACLHGGTQNQNESFNGLIWQRAPKITHSGLPTVELATYLAVGIFNDGAGSLLGVLEGLGIQPGVHCVNACKKLDRERLYHSVYKSSEKAKKRRRVIRNKKKGFAEALESAEGLQYEAGAF